MLAQGEVVDAEGGGGWTAMTSVSSTVQCVSFWR